MASILGKRRAHDPTSENSSSRVKRRANAQINDPKILCDARDATVLGYGCVDLDELENAPQTPSKPVRLLHSPARRSSVKQRVALSPRKANGETKASEIVAKGEESVQLPTPQTPRHRDALSKKVPVTPRHRVGLMGKPLTPRTPRTPFTPSNAPSVYNTARQLFTRSADPGRLVGREEERNELNTFIQNGIESKSGRCIGPPGTGKSALVNEVCHDIQGVGVKIAYINCMSVKSSEEIYNKLINELLNDDQVLEQDAMNELCAMFFPKKKAASFTYIVTLDEIDHLLTLDLEILYTLFEWSLHRSSRLVVIGIANALDLTERFLPRLKARNLKPQLLPFLPYTAPQIASVITTKLRSLSSADSTSQATDIPFFQPAAIQLCSKKVASQTGDLRKAFDIIRRTIDMIESETKRKYQDAISCQSLLDSPTKTPLAENPNLSSSRSDNPLPLAALTPQKAPRATIAHVSRISAAALSNGTPQRLQTLNLQQKAALCALISHQKSGRKAASSIFATPSKKAAVAPTVRRLHESYSALCKRENALHPLTATEFADVIGGLETLGLVGGEGGRGFGGTPKKGKRAEERCVICFVDEKEVLGCLEGVGGGILRGLLASDE